MSINKALMMSQMVVMSMLIVLAYDESGTCNLTLMLAIGMQSIAIITLAAMKENDEIDEDD